MVRRKIEDAIKISAEAGMVKISLHLNDDDEGTWIKIPSSQVNILINKLHSARDAAALMKSDEVK